MSKEPAVKPKMPMNLRFLEMDKWIGNPVIMGSGNMEQKDEVDKLLEDEQKRKIRH